MLKPFRILQNVPKSLAGFVRCKVIFQDSSNISGRRNSFIEWNKDTSNLFGRVLKTNKVKVKSPRKKKSGGNSKTPISDCKVVSGTLQPICIESDLCEKRSSRFIPCESESTTAVLHPIDLTETKVKYFPEKLPILPERMSNMKPLISNGVLATKSSPFLSIITRNLKTFPLLCSQKIESKPSNENKLIQVSAAMQGEATIYPAVTTILNETMSDQSKLALEKWKQEKISELGSKGFEAYQKAQLEGGIKFHKAIQGFLSKSKEPLLEKEIEGVWVSAVEVLRMVNNVKSIESHVSHPILKYRGIIDCIAHFEDKPTLIEWKKSDKPKHSLAATFDNPVQLAAYFGAVSHDAHYKQLKVRDVLLVIAYTDGSKADYFHLDSEAMRKHWGAWLTRYGNYLEMKGSDQTTLFQGGKRMFEEDIQHLE